MIEFLSELGMNAWDPFWVPVLVWTAVAIAVAIALRAVPRRQTRLHLDVRIALLLALPFGLLIANLLPLTQQQVVYVISLPAPAVSPVSVAEAPIDASSLVSTYTLIGGLTVFVIALSVLGVIRFIGACFGLRRLLTSATPVHTEALSSIRTLEQTESDELSRVRVLISKHAPVAFSCGLFRKKIILPLATDPEERLVLIHELAHHINGDIWRATIGQFVTSLFFFHPLVHLMHRDARLLVELACDEQVLIDSGVDRQQYANLLLRYAGQGSFKPTPALSMSDTHSHLQTRIHAMKTPFRKALGRRSVIAIATLVLGAGIFVSACSESALVGPDQDEFEQDDIMARVMRLPVAAHDTIYVIVETPPTLIGGLAGLQENIQYPDVARQASIEGRVFLQFVVKQDGSTSDIIVTRGIGGGCDAEAVRVVSEAHFVPGVQAGMRVPVKMSIPITFRLNPPPPVDVELVRRQLNDGTYQYNPDTWRAVSSGVVTGRILDASGNPILDAMVYLKHSDQEILMGGRNGRFMMGAPAGQWNLIVRTPDGEWEQEVTLPKGSRRAEKDLVIPTNR